ncbi:hypothetical protein E3P92_00562 [Wallemia ichthyophaga]|nr:hypothetical protein E3P91_03014 [Wallemia ichthyophaga]TIB18717.1 hypothetical protein E3P92_00562 [Wallemia ichthyophaga]TIB60866.1 hypothetical protein E3P78_02955 [Wallemia ichthyophaga]
MHRRFLQQKRLQSSSTKNLIPIRTSLKGAGLLQQPVLNKGSAFSREEREIFQVDGHIPYDVHSLEKQMVRAYAQFKRQPSNILKHAFLASLRDQNQILFYALVSSRLKEMLPVLYTPTVGEAVSQYSDLFRRPIGCFLSLPTAHTMREQLQSHANAAFRYKYPPGMKNSDTERPFDIVVVTDSEGILGIGDQGVGGISISTSKAALYVAGAGVDPNRILSVVLDVGTDNHTLFANPLYMGYKHVRTRGVAYDHFVHQFMMNIKELFPGALIHFEDFGLNNAARLLETYKPVLPCFNDDIEGTGAVALAATMSAIGVTKSKLCDQRIVVYGAGTAGMGIANQIRDAMIEVDGLTLEEANSRFWCIDRDGLLLKSNPRLQGSQHDYARDDEEVRDWTREIQEQPNLRILDVVKAVKPTMLVGCSTNARSFNEDVIRTMAEHVERPIIFPMSNPTSLVEVDPADANEWTDGRALIATGSPFPPAKNPITGKDYFIAEANNALIYPGLGLGTIASRSSKMSKGMILAGVKALASASPALEDPDAPLLPDLAGVRKVSLQIAAAVVRQAMEEGVANINLKKDDDAIIEHIKFGMWDPVYRPLELEPEDSTSD